MNFGRKHLETGGSFSHKRATFFQVSHALKKIFFKIKFKKIKL